MWFKRVDFELKNPRGLKLQCSQYYPLKHRKKLPVVIYSHGNSGSRLDALSILEVLLPMSICVVSFDFSGSGLSEGEYVSLGFYEQHDITTVVEYLRNCGTTTRIGLWGRSMGASASLMFASSDPSVACLVCDSPFSSLKVLCNELVDQMEQKIPKLIIGIALKKLQKTIKKKANFDIDKLEPIDHAPMSFNPALFAHGEQDTFIDPSHSKNIQKKYAGDNNRITFEGGHGDTRPEFFYNSAAIFISNNLLIDSDFTDDDNPLIDESVSKDTNQPSQLTKSQNNTNNKNNVSNYQNIVYIYDDSEEELRKALELSLL